MSVDLRFYTVMADLRFYIVMAYLRFYIVMAYLVMAARMSVDLRFYIVMACLVMAANISVLGARKPWLVRGERAWTTQLHRHSVSSLTNQHQSGGPFPHRQPAGKCLQLIC